MRVLIACEFTGTVRRAMERYGHDVMSCDLLPAADGASNHYMGDVREIMGDGWDMMIAHPTCKYLANSGSKHLYRGMKKINGPEPARWRAMEAGVAFFLELLNAPIKRKAVENPIMHGHAKALVGRQQTQTVQPWWFGHKEMKATCFWLEGLPPLLPTRVVGPPPIDPTERKKWAKVHRAPPSPDRWKFRSQICSGLADAMGLQWH